MSERAQVTVTARSRGVTFTVTYYVQVQPIIGGMAPIAGISSPVAAIPEVQTVAVKSLGISLGAVATEAIVEVAEGYEMMAVIEETVDETTGEKVQTITPKREGRLKLKVRTRDGRKSASVTIDILPEGGAPPGEPGLPPATPTPPTTPTPAPATPFTELKLRSSASVGLGKRMMLVPYVSPVGSDKTQIVWITSDPEIATVDGEGIVTGRKAGKVTITAVDPVSGLEATCKMTVKEDKTPVTSIALSKTDLKLNLGKTSSVSVTYKPSAPTIRGVSWSSSDENVVRVEPGGKITAVGQGKATIMARSDSNGRTAILYVTVVIPVTSVALSETKITLKQGSTYTLQPLITPSNATDKSATYTSSSTKVATVSAGGVIAAVKEGTATITVKVGGKSAKVTVVVVP
jgi:uncharacterized protein YjdB